MFPFRAAAAAIAGSSSMSASLVFCVGWSMKSFSLSTTVGFAFRSILSGICLRTHNVMSTISPGRSDIFQLSTRGMAPYVSCWPTHQQVRILRWWEWVALSIRSAVPSLFLNSFEIRCLIVTTVESLLLGTLIHDEARLCLEMTRKARWPGCGCHTSMWDTL